MAREWILNSMMNRFQLNYKRNVGSTSENIRKCAPKSLQEWEEYYFAKVKSRKEIEELGKKLYIKITEVLPKELEEITEKICIDYMLQLIINRTYEGYKNEIDTIYGQLESLLDCKIHPAPDEWDRLYGVDFYIEAGEKKIGLQIKPVDKNIQLPQIHKEKNIAAQTHRKWTEENKGRVFYIFSSAGTSDKKEIRNQEVVEEIRQEMKSLQDAL